jgi:hypothetical protein
MHLSGPPAPMHLSGSACPDALVGAACPVRTWRGPPRMISPGRVWAGRTTGGRKCYSESGRQAEENLTRRGPGENIRALAEQADQGGPESKTPRACGVLGVDSGLKRLRRGGEGGNPAEAFAKGGDSDERRVSPSLVSGAIIPALTVACYWRKSCQTRDFRHRERGEPWPRSSVSMNNIGAGGTHLE